MALKKIKVFGDYVYPHCIRKGKSLVCKPSGKRYKFRRYSYIMVDDKAPAPTSG